MGKFNSINDALLGLSRGEMIVVLDAEDRENEGDLVFPAECSTPSKVNFMMKFARGLICSPISKTIADRLGLDLMTSRNREFFKCNFTVSVDYLRGTTTGISASDRSKTLVALADSSVLSGDFATPGHVFPLIAHENGVLDRQGHTEAAIDLVRLAGFSSSAGVLCEIADEDGEMMRGNRLFDFAKRHSLKIVTISDLLGYRVDNEV